MFDPITDGARHPGLWACRLAIASQYEARTHGAAWGTTHLISIHGSQNRLITLGGLPTDRHLVLMVDDTTDPDSPHAPAREHVESVCAFVDGLPMDARLLVHCLQGVSRATAVGLGILARYLEPEAAGAALHGLRPMAVPSPLLLSRWDEALDLGGALSAIGARFPCRVWKARRVD